jgi:IS5 family transposase
MERVVPWDKLAALVEAHYGAKGKASGVGRPPFALQTMLHIRLLQQWLALSEPAMEAALFDVPLFREFAQLPTGVVRLPDEGTILRFRHLLEKHGLAAHHGQRRLVRQGPAAEGRHRGRCHADRGTQLHQEQVRRA